MAFDAFDLIAIINQIGRDKGISRDALIEAVESAMLSAARKHFGHNLNLEVKFNDEYGEIEIIQFKTVVERVEDFTTQISLEEARKEFDPDAMIGDELGKKLSANLLGRIDAQTAKQVIIQKVRDAERLVIYDEYKDSKGELVNGTVQRSEKGGNLIVNLGRTEAVVPKREQITREKYRQNDKIRAMILDIDRSARGPQIVLTRSHPDFLRKLFEIEVPEINEGVIEIKGVAREPGVRAKIAVRSTDSAVDPTGACVGVRGSRVQSVVQELRGERIDIVPWTADDPSFVARALHPAEVTRVVVDEDDHSMEVIVADDQLSLAIGRGGVNVRLASKLSGWRIDVRSVSVAEEESRRARASIGAIPDIQFTEAELLFQSGFRSAKEIAEASLEDLLEIQNMTPERAKELLKSTRNHVEKLKEEGRLEEAETESQITDLDKLLINPDLRSRLLAAGFKTIQSLIDIDSEVLRAAGAFTEGDEAALREAVDNFLRGGVALR